MLLLTLGPGQPGPVAPSLVVLAEKNQAWLKNLGMEPMFTVKELCRGRLKLMPTQLLDRPLSEGPTQQGKQSLQHPHRQYALMF